MSSPSDWHNSFISLTGAGRVHRHQVPSGRTSGRQALSGLALDSLLITEQECRWLLGLGTLPRQPQVEQSYWH